MLRCPDIPPVCTRDVYVTYYTTTRLTAQAVGNFLLSEEVEMATDRLEHMVEASGIALPQTLSVGCVEEQLPGVRVGAGWGYGGGGGKGGV